MSVTVYKRGEHNSGFVGVRVVRGVDGKSRQRYISYLDTDGNLCSAKEQKARKGEADALDAQWLADQQTCKKNKANSAGHADGINSLIRIGVKGLRPVILSHSKQGSDDRYYSPGFTSNSQQGDRPQFFPVLTLGYRSAWSDAIDHFCSQRDVSVTERKRMLDMCPSVDVFAAIRKRLISKGHKVPYALIREIRGNVENA